MASGTAVGVGLGVTLGVLALIAIILLVVGLCTSRRRQADQEEEMQQRRSVAQQQYQQEQANWRERRLRQVVLVLVDRGEAEEAVPLAFQLPNHSEVLARRKLRNMRASQRARLEEVSEEQDPRLDEQARAITRMTLDELLADGRPQDAEPGPDIMQLLLEGQEVRPAHSGDDEDNEDEFIDVSPQPTPQATPQAQDLSIQNPNRSPQSGAIANHNLTSSDEQVDRNNNHNSNNSNNGSGSDDSFTPANAEEARRKKQEQAIIKELRAERDNTRRRKTAEELYGPGVPYIANPNNDAVNKSLDPAALGSTLHPHEPGSAFTRFLSPLTPWRGKKRRASAFDGKQPPELGSSTRPPATPSGLPRGPNRQNTSAFDQANAEADAADAAAAQSPGRATGRGRESAASSEPF